VYADLTFKLFCAYTIDLTDLRDLDAKRLALGQMVGIGI
jgi:hypothetical protein